MDITLNHTIIPAYDKVKSAKFYERIFGFKFLKVWLDDAKINHHYNGHVLEILTHDYILD